MTCAVDNRLFVTEGGKWLLEAEIACLRQLRRDACVEPDLHVELSRLGILGLARTSADLEAIDQEIGQLESTLCSAVVLPDPHHRVAVGSRVTLSNEDGSQWVVAVVGPLAADFRADLVSYTSRAGRALMGLRAGESVEIESRYAVWRACILDVDVMQVEMIAGSPGNDE